MGLPSIIPGFVAIGVLVCGAIMLGLWANDGIQKSAFDGRVLSNCAASGNQVCAFLSAYSIAIAGSGMAIIGGILALLSGFALRGENGCMRALVFIFLLVGGILSLSAFVIFLVTFPSIFGGISLNAYGRAMMAFTFLTFGTSIACGVLTLIAHD